MPEKNNNIARSIHILSTIKKEILQCSFVPLSDRLMYSYFHGHSFNISGSVHNYVFHISQKEALSNDYIVTLKV
jgi:hypothetical protein